VLLAYRAPWPKVYKVLDVVRDGAQRRRGNPASLVTWLLYTPPRGHRALLALLGLTRPYTGPTALLGLTRP